MERLTRRSVLAGIAGLSAQPALANLTEAPRPVPRRGVQQVRPERDLAEASRALISEFDMSGTFACMVAEAHSGAVVFTEGADRGLPPASVTKAITAAYGFDILGPGHRFETRVLATGPVRNGRLEGDLVLAGGGSPTLSTADLALLTARLKSNGLREITGEFQVWAGALPSVQEIDPGQPDHLGYNASISGLNLNYNRVHFEWRRRGESYDISLDARAGRYTPQVSHATMQVAARAQPVYRHRTDPETGRELWSVSRQALGGGGTRWLPVRDSALYSGDVFRTLARSEGIVLPEPLVLDNAPEGAVLASHVGPALDEIVEGMLRYSNNMTAEVIGLAATAAVDGAPPQNLASSAARMTLWARDALGMTDSRFVDHSGLGDMSLTTPQDLCRALVALGPDGALRRELREITLRRDDGTPEALTLYAKTGTLNFVSALAGHIRRPGGPPLVFAILTADLDRRAAIPPGGEERPPGSAAWTGRSRAMQFDLVRLWAALA